MPKQYGVMISGCNVCQMEPEMRPFVGDKDDAIKTRDAWNRDNGGPFACTEAYLVRVKHVKVESN